MDIKTIAVTYHRKFNLGDYESLGLGCSLWAQIDPEEDADGVTQFLYQQAKASVKEAARPVIQESIYQMNKARMQRQSTKSQIEKITLWKSTVLGNQKNYLLHL